MRIYIQDNIENGSIILVARDRSYPLGDGEVCVCESPEDLNETFQNLVSDYGTENFDFEVFEVTLTKRSFNIIDPVPAQIALI